MLPFTVQDFFSIFSAYNEAIWPLQIVAALSGVMLAALPAVGERKYTSRVILAALGLY